MRSLFALLIAIALSSVATACGGVSKGAGSTSHVSSQTAASSSASASTSPGATQASRPVENDNDGDGDGGADDNGWGHAASTGDRRAVVALVKRYYAFAAADDGTAACSLIYSIFAEEIPEVYGEPPGEPALRGKTCGVVMSKFFRQIHRWLTTDLATLEVIDVRVKGLRGLALLSFKNTPEHDIPVHLEHRVWKIDALLDGGLG
jgi:hypothetical protein